MIWTARRFEGNPGRRHGRGKLVTHETDFLELYRRLGLNPGCDLAELKQAYRRHVAALHPDRHHGRPVDPRTAARLQRLTAQYSAAMEFHRRHGRLPGAPQTAGASTSGGHELSSAVRQAHDPFAARRNASYATARIHDDHSPEEQRSRRRLALWLVIAALGALGWAMHSATLTAGGDGDDEAVVQAGAGSVSREQSVEDIVLHVGMSADDVRHVEGEPLATHGDLWEYGPSWIRFDHDEVVEWHSSPLHPLHTEARAATQ